MFPKKKTYLIEHNVATSFNHFKNLLKITMPFLIAEHSGIWIHTKVYPYYFDFRCLCFVSFLFKLYKVL